MSIEKKAINGAFSMVIRFAITQVVVLVGGIFLARYLTPTQFGTYNIILSFVNFLSFFGDAGLGSALVQQKNDISSDDLSLVFTFQIVVFGGITLILGLLGVAAHLIGNHVSQWFYAVIAISSTLLFVCLRTISSIQCERLLDFKKIAFVEINEVCIFQALCIILALSGLGTWSFIIALCARNIWGALLFRHIFPWKMAFSWNRQRLYQLIKFGAPYQAVPFISLIKDAITPIIIGSLLGLQFVGYVNWASTMTLYPLILINVIMRVAFPAFSRIQDNQETLTYAINTLIRYNCMIVYGLFGIIVALILPITEIIFGKQWLPALPFYYIISILALITPVTTPLTVAINASGRSQLYFFYVVLWACMNWIFGVPGILAWQLTGFGIATLVVYSTNIFLVRSAKKLFVFNIWKNMSYSFIALCCTFIVLRLIQIFSPIQSIQALIAAAIFGLVVYLATSVLFSKGLAWNDTKFIVRQITSRLSLR